MFRAIFGKKTRSDSQISPTETIVDAVVGDVFTITNFNIEYEESYFVVDEVNRFSSVSGDWFETQGVDGEKQIWVYWSGLRPPDVGVMVDDRPIGLVALGMDEDTLIKMDEEQSIDNHVEIEDTLYYYRSSGETIFFQDNEGDGEGFYMWDFLSEDGKRNLSIDKWEGVPFRGHFSEVVPSEEIAVYRR